MAMEDLKYNNVNLLGTDDEKYYLKPLQKYADTEHYCVKTLYAAGTVILITN